MFLNEAGGSKGICGVLKERLVQHLPLSIRLSFLWLTFKKGTMSFGTSARLGQDEEQTPLAKLWGVKINLCQLEPQPSGTWHLHESEATQGSGNNFVPLFCFVRLCLKRCLGQYFVILSGTVGYSYWMSWKLRAKWDKRDTDVDNASLGLLKCLFFRIATRKHLIAIWRSKRCCLGLLKKYCLLP